MQVWQCLLDTWNLWPALLERRDGLRSFLLSGERAAFDDQNGCILFRSYDYRPLGCDRVEISKMFIGGVGYSSWSVTLAQAAHADSIVAKSGKRKNLRDYEELQDVIARVKGACKDAALEFSKEQEKST